MPRYLLPSEGVYHVTSRGVARCDIFLDDDDRVPFVNDLRIVVRRQRLKGYAFCLIGNHYHAIFEAHLDRLSAALLGSGVNRREGRSPRAER
jgi:hypothetical protein